MSVAQLSALHAAERAPRARASELPFRLAANRLNVRQARTKLSSVNVTELADETECDHSRS